MAQWKLNAASIKHATQVGMQRNAIQRSAGQADRKVADKQGSVAVDIDGARAERAFSEYAGVPWVHPVHSREDWEKQKYEGLFIPDVGPVEVRATKHLDGHLILQFDDRPDVLNVLVRVGQHPDYEIVGGLFGHDCKAEYWCRVGTRPGITKDCYLIPTEVLLPPDAIVKLLEGWGCTTCRVRCSWYSGKPPGWCTRSLKDRWISPIEQRKAASLPVLSK